MRLIDADALMKAIDSDIFNTESRRCYEKMRVRKQPTIEHYGNIDISANAVFDIATREEHLRFRETDEMCPRCQRDLEVYYCENRTYSIR